MYKSMYTCASVYTDVCQDIPAFLCFYQRGDEQLHGRCDVFVARFNKEARVKRSRELSKSSFELQSYVGELEFSFFDGVLNTTILFRKPQTTGQASAGRAGVAAPSGVWCLSMHTGKRPIIRPVSCGSAEKGVQRKAVNHVYIYIYIYIGISKYVNAYIHGCRYAFSYSFVSEQRRS